MRRKIFLLTGLSVTMHFFVFAQDINAIINAKEVERIEKILSADDMQGRAAFTPAIDRAADFIQKEFKTAGLETPANSGTYLQDFYITKTKFISANAILDGQVVDARNIVAFTSDLELYINQDSGYMKAFIRPGDDFNAEAAKYIQSDKSYLPGVGRYFVRKKNA